MFIYSEALNSTSCHLLRACVRVRARVSVFARVCLCVSARTLAVGKRPKQMFFSAAPGQLGALCQCQGCQSTHGKSINQKHHLKPTTRMRWTAFCCFEVWRLSEIMSATCTYPWILGRLEITNLCRCVSSPSLHGAPSQNKNKSFAYLLLISQEVELLNI